MGETGGRRTWTIAITIESEVKAEIKQCPLKAGK